MISLNIGEERSNTKVENIEGNKHLNPETKKNKKS